MSLKPHGGMLIHRAVRPDEGLLKELRDLPSIELSHQEESDLFLIAYGGLSPLTGFMSRDQYLHSMNRLELIGGLPWGIPITLSPPDEVAVKLKEGRVYPLKTCKGRIAGTIEVHEVYPFDKREEARMVFKTEDDNHPGVKRIYAGGSYHVGGEIRYFEGTITFPFEKYNLKPEETRRYFKDMGWKTIVAFQTRNPVHRAHEYIQKCAMEIVDGLLLHPIVGETKEGDISAEVRMECYLALLKNYYPRDRVLLSVFPWAMRYGGPREAIQHAIIRKNYGCTHIIIGRDHAGVGSYYGSYDAQYIFDEVDREKLEIKPLFFENAFYCRKCNQMATPKTCPHDDEFHLTLSGTKVRQMLRDGIKPPLEFTREEVADILMKDTGK